MNVRRVYKWCAVSALAAFGLTLGLNKALSAPPATFAQAGPADAEQGVQVLTRGPVHEAFAEAVTYNPEPGVVATKAPPAAIDEVPPEQRPEGNNVAWIPGYWAWDDERNDFLWVSGVWRDLPPGRQWVPGYWGKSGQGYQWTSGYWADAKASEVEYLPEPPASVEVGPNVAAPSADQTWLPGCWVWQNSRYAWRPGFWADAQPDWIWVPAHYVWSPRGYVFVDGYWDYSINRRGVLFAPVEFSAGVYARPGFSYSPSTVIDLGVFANFLFLRPRYQHYYFGDYYAANYQANGFYPAYSYNSGRFGYDPIFANERWRNRLDRGWEQRQQADFLNRRNREDLRPPRTWAEQRRMDSRAAQARARGLAVATPFDDLRRNQNGPQRFQPVDQAQRRQFSQHAQEVQRLREQRQNLENGAAGAPSDTRAKGFTPTRAKLPGSPIVAQPGANVGKDRAPPRTYQTPKPDMKVEPKPRAVRSPAQPQQREVKRVPLDRPQRQPQAQPKRAAPKPQRQPQAQRAAPQQRGNAPAAGAKQDQRKGKDQN